MGRGVASAGGGSDSSFGIWVSDLGCRRAHETSRHRAEAAGVVRAERARSALAPHARPLWHEGLGNHAPATPGQDGPILLGALDAGVAEPRGARQSQAAHAAQTLGRTRLLHPRA